MRAQIIFATGNKDKVREIREILAPWDVTILSMKEAGVAADPEENGTTFEENALIKAGAVAEKLFGTPEGRHIVEAALPAPTIVMSDDSGLCIDALDGAPGIYSARFMGHEANYTDKMNTILGMLENVPEEKRTARFVAAIAAVFPKGLDPCSEETESRVVRGVMEGTIAHEILGKNGFGYDPFFWLPDIGRTSAEISDEEKNERSHRGNALRAMMALLSEEFPRWGAAL